jgi:hypothetical protein
MLFHRKIIFTGISIIIRHTFIQYPATAVINTFLLPPCSCVLLLTSNIRIHVEASLLLVVTSLYIPYEVSGSHGDEDSDYGLLRFEYGLFLKMEVIRSCETLVTIYKTTRRHTEKTTVENSI